MSPDADDLNRVLLSNPLLSRVAPHLTGRVSVVGGMVRDALLGRPHTDDVDLVVEGDAVALARQVGHALGVLPAVHERFGTAVLTLPHHGGHVDFITARRETYARPGALPDVQAGTLADDLARRDFTVNAMAFGVVGEDAGRLADPHGGRADLAAGRVRMLRSGAFTEDPSRVVRAARYAGRLGFALEDRTRAEAAQVAGALPWDIPRVGEELRRLLQEADPGPGVAVLAALGAPGVRTVPHPQLKALDAALATDGAPDVPVWALRLGACLEPAARDRVALPGWAGALAAEVAAGAALAERLAAAQRPSRVDALLSATPAATAVAACALGAPGVVEWWATHRDVRLAISGKDLMAAGIPAGPDIGRALRAVRAAVLDGEVHGAEGQLALALRVVRDDALRPG